MWIKKRQSVKDLGSSTAYNWRKNNLLLKYYWHRVAGCSLSWFVWDFAFYGEVGRGAMPGLVRTVATAPCPRAAAPLCVPRQQAVPVHLHPSDRARGIDHHHPGVDPAQLHGRAGWLLLCCFHDRQALDGAPLHAGHGEGWWAWAGCAAACARYKLMHASAPPLHRALLGWLCCSWSALARTTPSSPTTSTSSSSSTSLAASGDSLVRGQRGVGHCCQP